MSTLLLIYIHGDNVTEAQRGHTEGTGEPGGLQVLYIQYRQEKISWTTEAERRGERDHYTIIHQSLHQVFFSGLLILYQSAWNDDIRLWPKPIIDSIFELFVKASAYK